VEAFAIPFLLVVGTLLAVQTAANVQLSTATGSPFGASMLQLGIGATVLLAAAAIAGTLDAFGRLAGAGPWWHLIGGFGSAIYVTSGIVLFPRLGAVVTVGLWIAGQMLGSLALDGFGWLGVEAEPLGAPEALGGLAVLTGAALIVRAQAERGALASVLRERGGWLMLAVLAGAVLPIQGAINAQLRADLDATIPVGALSFLVATVGMGLVLAGSMSIARAPRPRIAPLRRVPWWGWLGGLAGAIYVTAVFSLIPEIGAAATIALTVGGQQLASVAVDRFGLFRLPRRPIAGLRLVAVGALLSGVVLIQIA
jgi:bacterial/archaeal transporter family-2 protein